MKEVFSKIPENTFKWIGVNAGMLLSDFTPGTGAFLDTDIIGATTGGISFSASPEYDDWGDDIDNCPKNTKELKRITNWEITCSGTFVSMTADLAERLTAAADNTSGHIVPRDILDLDKDFRDLWIVGDYSDKNTGENAGYIAIHMMNALSTTGFQIKTEDKEKMQFSFEFTSHYSIDAQDTVPYEIYIKAGSNPSTTPTVLLHNHYKSVLKDATVPIGVDRVYPADSAITWSSSDSTKASVDSDGNVTGEAVGSAIITASITVNSIPYTDTCTVQVKQAL